MSDLSHLVNLLLLFLIPLGHVSLRQRAPKVTIGLLIVNTIIYFISFNVEVAQQVAMIPATLKLELAQQPLLISWLKQQGKAKPEEVLQQVKPEERAKWSCEFDRDLAAGRVAPKDSDEYLRWHEARLNFEEKQNWTVWFRFGFRPSAPDLIGAFTYMFLHGGFWHLFWNMYYLWLLGCNLENVWSRKYFLLVYLAGGLAAALTDFLVRSGGCFADTPAIGASGAISAVMGAFLIRYWNTRLRFLFFTRIFLLPVWLPLSAWFLRQLYYGFHFFDQNMSVNFWMHVGGFTFGMLVALGFRHYRVEEEVIAKELRRQDERDWKKSEAAAAAAQALARPADLVLGVEARQVGRLEEAREHLERAAKEFPFNLDVHFELQQVLQRLGLIQEANAHQGAVVGALLEMGKTEEALARYHRLLQVAPDAVAPGRSQYRLARLLEEKREWFAAAAAYRAFATREPQDELAPKALFLSGLLLLDRLHQPAQAAAMFDYLRQRYPDHPIQQHVTPVRERALARQRKEEV